MKIYNIENYVLGRVSTRIAKDLLKGENVVIVNAEKSVISGNPRKTIEYYKKKRKRGDTIHGPFFPRTPQGIVKRTIRGMLPLDKAKGRKAFRKLKVFASLPKEFENKTFETVEDAKIDKLKCKFITLKELSSELGGIKRIK